MYSTTLDIDLAVVALETLPRVQLTAAGFHFRGRHAHSENWIGLDDTPVQFTDDPQLVPAISRAVELSVEAVGSCWRPTPRAGQRSR